MATLIPINQISVNGVIREAVVYIDTKKVEGVFANESGSTIKYQGDIWSIACSNSQSAVALLLADSVYNDYNITLNESEGGTITMSIASILWVYASGGGSAVTFFLTVKGVQQSYSVYVTETPSEIASFFNTTITPIIDGAVNASQEEVDAGTVNDKYVTPLTLNDYSGWTKVKVGLGNVVNADTTTTANITDSTNKRFITDAQQTVLGNTSGTNSGDNAVNSLYSGLASSKQDTLVSGTNIKSINGNSLLGSGNLVVGTNVITATETVVFGSEEDTAVTTVTSALITSANIIGALFIPIETTETSLDDFKLNGVSFNIENIVDNTSFDIRAVALNNATGTYTITYKIQY